MINALPAWQLPQTSGKFATDRHDGATQQIAGGATASSSRTHRGLRHQLRGDADDGPASHPNVFAMARATLYRLCFARRLSVLSTADVAQQPSNVAQGGLQLKLQRTVALIYVCTTHTKHRDTTLA